MADEYKQSPRVEHVAGNVTYNNYEGPHSSPPPAPARSTLWRWLGGLAAVLAIGGGTLATTYLNSKVYYCASHNSVKYHTDATCPGLTLCGYKVKSMSLSQARSKMDLCKMCH